MDAGQVRRIHAAVGTVVDLVRLVEIEPDFVDGFDLAVRILDIFDFGKLG